MMTRHSGVRTPYGQRLFQTAQSDEGQDGIFVNLPNPRGHYLLTRFSERTGTRPTICVTYDGFEQARQLPDNPERMACGYGSRFIFWGSIFGGQEYRERQISTQYEKVLSNDSNFPITVCLPWSLTFPWAEQWKSAVCGSVTRNQKQDGGSPRAEWKLSWAGLCDLSPWHNCSGPFAYWL